MALLACGGVNTSDEHHPERLEHTTVTSTAFSRTKYFDQWDADGVRFVFGYDASQPMTTHADAVEEAEYRELVRRADQAHAVRTLRAKQPWIKEQIVRKRGFLNLCLAREDLPSSNTAPGTRAGPIASSCSARRSSKNAASCVSGKTTATSSTSPTTDDDGVRPVASTRATRLFLPRGPSIHVNVRCGGYRTMQIGIDIWFLESLFARFKRAAHLVDNIDDPIVSDELAKSINNIHRRLAELLGKPCDPQASGEPSGSQAAEEPTEDGEPDELELANLLDDLCWSVARADTFTSATESLIREFLEEESRQPPVCAPR
jgi:hypothetical protein